MTRRKKKRLRIKGPDQKEMSTFQIFANLAATLGPHAIYGAVIVAVAAILVGTKTEFKFDMSVSIVATIGAGAYALHERNTRKEYEKELEKRDAKDADNE